MQVVQSRLAELEPGFEGRLRFTFAGSEGDRYTLRTGPAPEGRWLRGAGPLLAEVGRQLSPWVRSRAAGLDASALELGLAPGDPQHPHLAAHLAEGAVLGLAAVRRDRFHFPCSPRSYEERDLTQPSRLDPATLQRALEATGLAGLAVALGRAEESAGINGVALAALAAWQSAWGTSRMAREQQNPLAWGAGAGGTAFASAAESVVVVAGLIRRHYLEPGGEHYHGPNLTGLNVAYAADPMWRHGVAGLWRQLAARLKG